MKSRSDLTRIIKRISLITGILILLISVQFSYDGFDQRISGANDGYSTLAIFIGYTLAVVFSVIEFIFGTSSRELNWTLRCIGVFAYGYSIYTNYLGIKHLLGADEFMAWTLAVVIDVFPEPAIAWALGESLTGDLIGNIGNIILGTSGQSESEKRGISRISDNFRPQNPKYQPKHKPNLGPIFPASDLMLNKNKEPTYHSISNKPKRVE